MTYTSQDIEKMDVKELRKKRGILLAEIHEKQQELDQMDYEIYQKKEKQKKPLTSRD